MVYVSTHSCCQVPTVPFTVFLSGAAPDVAVFFNQAKLGDIYLNGDSMEFCCYEVFETILRLGSLISVWHMGYSNLDMGAK